MLFITKDVDVDLFLI